MQTKIYAADHNHRADEYHIFT